MFSVETIYFIFPILCILFSIGKQNKKKILIFFCFLIIFIAFSKMGSDYSAYEKQYELIAAGENLNRIHGEILFKQLMKLFSTIGLNYIGFRILLLVTLYGLLSILIYKMSKNHSCSFLIIYSTYLIYLCSAYRQFIVMILIFLSFYLFEKKKIKITLFVLIVSIFFHISGIIALVYFLFLIIRKNKCELTRKKIFFLLGVSIILSFLLRIFKKWIILVADIFNRKEHLMHYIDFDRTLMNMGFISRLFILIVLIVFIKFIKKNELYTRMFYFYLFGFLIYIITPSEIMAGRFSNNARIVEIFLMPYIIFKGEIYEKILKMIIFSIYLGLILYYQLSMQDGYYPYINILI